MFDIWGTNYLPLFGRRIDLCAEQESPTEVQMKRLVITALLCLATTAAAAQTSTCQSQATDKKLAGAALNSFMKKCQKDAQTTCDSSAADKKLAGAAKTSFTKKCVKDSVGTGG
jgi:hypothetical protein